MASDKPRERKTPGVYVTDRGAFPPSIVCVQTAVPAFVGYTEKATVEGKPALLRPVEIRSLADYESIFGRGYHPKFRISVANDGKAEFEVDNQGTLVRYKLTETSERRYVLYNSIRLFFENGGQTAYIVSVGDYSNAISKDDLKNGLRVVGEETGPTMLVVPDAVLLPGSGTIGETELPSSSDFASVVQSMLDQAVELQDRVAILDVYGTKSLDPASPTYANQLESLNQQFHKDVGSDGLSYGMAYFPFLNTSVVPVSEIDFTSIDSSDVPLADVLEAENARLYQSETDQQSTVSRYIHEMANVGDDVSAINSLNQRLRDSLPVMTQILQSVAAMSGVLPPSGALAGIFTLNDKTRGVWNAPANYPLMLVSGPSVNLNDAQQGEFNMPSDGKSVNVIRAFPGRGTVVWGARTLDGNSNDWRYIQVRRTLIYIEQSIKAALDQYTFEPNDGDTWVTAVSAVSNFLTDLWTRGGLMGTTASEAFSVECGLGSTMTAQDIQEGYMIVQVLVQMIRPAEFIALTFRQQMEP